MDLDPNVTFNVYLAIPQQSIRQLEALECTQVLNSIHVYSELQGFTRPDIVFEPARLYLSTSILSGSVFVQGLIQFYRVLPS